MQIQFMSVVWSALALVAGVIVGLSFGLVQTRAWRRNQQLEQSGRLSSSFAVMPGSMRRVAYLIVALALVQILCPLLFTHHFEWWVSAGVVGGYGTLLFSRLRQRMSNSH
jgi:Na+/H+-dicarboxylate symporter